MNTRTARRTAAVMLAVASLAGGLSARAGVVNSTYLGPVVGSYGDPLNWSGGVVPNNGNGGNTYNVFIDGNAGQNSTVNLDINATINNLTVDAGDVLNITNARSLELAGDGVNASLSGGGTVAVASTGSYTDLRLSAATTTFSGVAVTLSNAARILGGGTLVINSGSISGETSNTGGLGYNAIAIVNHATINANVGGLVLEVDPSAAGLLNTGLMEATSAGILQLSGYGGGAFNNAGGTISAAGPGSTVRLINNAAIAGGTLSSSAGGIITTSGGGLGISALTNNATLVIANGTNLSADGEIVDNGGITVQSTGSYTDLILGPGVTLSGTGTVVMTNAARIRGGGSLFNATGHSIVGESSNSGSLGNNETGLNNAGVINANVSGLQLDVDPSGATGLVNTGAMQATAGGILQLNGYGGGAFNNAGGTISAIGMGSTVTLVNSAAITGGTLSSPGGGTFVAVGGGASLTSLTSNATVIIPNGANLTLAGTIIDNGGITIQSTGSYTDLIVSPGVTLAGTGTVVMTNAARIRGGGSLLNPAGHSIVGESSNSGTIGNNDTGLYNAGTINANVAGLALLVDPSGVAGLVNTGVMTATGGGILQLSGYGGGAFDNSAGVITAVGAGSQVQLIVGATINGGTLGGGSGGTFLVPGGNPTVSGVTLAVPLILANGAGASFVGTIVDNAGVTIASTGSFTDFILGADVTLTGTGTLSVTSAARVRGGNTLVNAAGHSIAGDTNGGGNIGNNDTNLVNGGRISANVGGAVLVVDPGGVGGIINTGTLEAVNGGILQLSGYGGGTFFNDGGQINAGNGSEVQFLFAPTIVGGTLGSSGAGLFRAVQTGTTLAGLTINAPVVVTNGSNIVLAGTIVNNGIMSIASTGSFTDLLTNGGDVTLAGTGSVVVSSAARVRGGGTITNGPGHTISGETAGGGTLLSNEASLINQGVVAGNVAGGTLLIDPAGTATGFRNDATGTVRAAGGGSVYFSYYGGGQANNLGTFDVLNGSSILGDTGYLANLSGDTLTGGTYRITSTGTAAILRAGGSVGQIVHNAAAVYLSGAGRQLPEIAGLHTNSGTFSLASGAAFAIAGDLQNSGTLAIGGGSQLAATGSLAESSPAVLTGAGMVSAAAALLAGQLAPGDAGPGTLTITSPTVLATAVAYDYDLGAIAGPNDLLVLLGGASTPVLDGLLHVNALPGFGPGTYTLIDSVSPFAPAVSIGIGSLPAGYAGGIVVTGGGGDYHVNLQVALVPEATWAGLAFPAAALLARRRRGR